MAVNRIRYIEMNHGRVYSTLFRAIALLGHAMRAYRKKDRHALGFAAKRSRWRELPGLSPEQTTRQPGNVGRE
jgi:hypothetical protein